MRDYKKFFTPPGVAHFLIAMADVFRGMKIIEPHAGDGAIVNELRECFGTDVNIQAVEINTKHWSDLKGANCIALVDFLDWPAQGQFYRVIANPPFGNGVDLTKHFIRMVQHLKPTGILVSIVPLDFELPSCCHLLFSSPLPNWSKNSDGSETFIKVVKVMPMPQFEKIQKAKDCFELISDGHGVSVPMLAAQGTRLMSSIK